jgi:membrane protein
VPRHTRHLLRPLPALARLVRQAALGWSEHNASSMGAAIAFYTVFSIAPILVIAVGVVGVLLGTDTVRSALLAQMDALLGPAGASAVATLLSNTSYMGQNRLATSVGVVTFLIGASSVFIELQEALSRIWGTAARVRGRTLWQLVRSHLLSVGLVLGVGFLLLVSLVANAALDAMGSWLDDVFGHGTIFLHIVNLVLGLSMSTLVFGLVFKLVPAEPIDWADVWVGAIVTAVLFSVGKVAIGLYLGRNAFTSVYGAAGSFIVLLLWVYYSAQIFLFGAEFTRAYTYTHGTRTGAGPRHAESKATIQTPPRLAVSRKPR